MPYLGVGESGTILANINMIHLAMSTLADTAFHATLEAEPDIPFWYAHTQGQL
jgi:hypothetical protein